MGEGFVCDMCKEALHGSPYVVLSGEYETHEWCESCYSKFICWVKKQSEEVVEQMSGFEFHVWVAAAYLAGVLMGALVW